MGLWLAAASVGMGRTFAVSGPVVLDLYKIAVSDIIERNMMRNIKYT